MVSVCNTKLDVVQALAGMEEVMSSAVASGACSLMRNHRYSLSPSILESQH